MGKANYLRNGSSFLYRTPKCLIFLKHGRGTRQFFPSATATPTILALCTGRESCADRQRQWVAQGFFSPKL